MLFFYLSSYSSIKWRRTPFFHIAKAGIQVDVLHAFHDIGVYEGAGLSEGADKLLHLLALGGVHDISRLPCHAPCSLFLCNPLRKPAGTLEEMQTVVILPGQYILFLYIVQGRINSMPWKFVL